MSDDELAAYRAKRQAKWQRRKALKMSSWDGTQFTVFDVAERDSWICGICDESIDPALAHPDRMSLSLDHIIALANGGAHSLANVQPAHLVCNTIKRDREASWAKERVAAG